MNTTPENVPDELLIQVKVVHAQLLIMFCNSSGFLSVKDAFSKTGYPAFYR